MHRFLFNFIENSDFGTNEFSACEICRGEINSIISNCRVRINYKFNLTFKIFNSRMQLIQSSNEASLRMNPRSLSFTWLFFSPANKHKLSHLSVFIMTQFERILMNKLVSFIENFSLRQSYWDITAPSTNNITTTNDAAACHLPHAHPIIMMFTRSNLLYFCQLFHLMLEGIEHNKQKTEFNLESHKSLFFSNLLLSHYTDVKNWKDQSILQK